MAGQVALFSSIYFQYFLKLKGNKNLQLKMHIGDTDREESPPTKVQTPEGFWWCNIKFLQCELIFLEQRVHPGPGKV